MLFIPPQSSSFAPYRLKLLTQIGQHHCEFADDARLSTADETNIFANELPYSGFTTNLLQGRKIPASAVCVLGGRQRTRQKQEKRSAGSVKIVRPLQEQFPFFNMTTTEWRDEILLHCLNIKVTRVVILTKCTVQYEPLAQIPPVRRHASSPKQRHNPNKGNGKRAAAIRIANV